MLEEYISKIDEACGKGKEFIVTLKHSNRDKALKKVLEKCCGGKSPTGMLIKGNFKDKEVSIFRTGKIVIRAFNGSEEAEHFLEELFK